MPIKIFHTADLHIGMKFNNYPERVKEALRQARMDVLKKMIQYANEHSCDIFIVTGDLFHSISSIDKKTIAHTANTLGTFEGKCVLIMPGNHDYDNKMIELWNTFSKNISEKILFLNEESPISLTDYGLDAVVYPAPCHSKHSTTNNLGWIKDCQLDNNLINIGIAHGSLEGISPDMNMNYFCMTQRELDSIHVDIWLIGHTHVSYPDNQSVHDQKVFNAGTPEPDGLDCSHGGTAWIISVDEQKNIDAEKISTGIYKFVDQEFKITDKDDIDKIQLYLLKSSPKTIIARIHLKGRVEEDTFLYRQNVISNLENSLGYLIVDDNDLGIRITKEKINKEFSEGSFPYQLLSSLSDDDAALTMAYELIMEVKK